MGHRRPALGSIWSVLFALGLAGAVAYSVVRRSAASEADLFAAVLGLAVAASAAGWGCVPPAQRRSWQLASLALGGFFAGCVLSRGLPAGIGAFPGAARTVFAVSCLGLAAAAARLGAGGEDDRDPSAWLDVGILTAVAFVVVWDLTMEPYVVDPALGTTTKLSEIAHPLIDVCALGLVLRLVLSRAGRDRRIAAFAAGAIVLLVANLVFCWLNLSGSFSADGAVGGVWLFGYLLIGFAALQPSEPQPALSRGGAVMGRARLGVVLLAVFVPEVVLARDLVHRNLVGLNTLTVGVFISTLVIALAAFRLLRSLEARLSALILHSADAIFLIDRERRIAYASPSAEELWGRKAEALLGTSMLDAFVEDHRPTVARQLDNLLAMPRGGTVPLEGRVCAAGGVRVVEGIGQNLLEDENVRSVVITMRDTTSRRALEQQLERRAFRDDLTGLANRALFIDRLEHALRRSLRADQVGIAVLFVDLDDFKAVNDGMGHAAGDALLRGVAERIRSCVRPADTVARLGGDEFIVLVEDIPSQEHVTALARRLLEVLQLPIDVTGVSLAVPASVGVSFATRDSTAESLLRDADIAMYSAKSQGKGRVTMFDETLRDMAVQRLAFKVELPEALRAQQFSLAYQQIKDVRSTDLAGFEALIRWRHPQRGLISPAKFIPAAEETGAIVDIGRWVLTEACRQAVLWNSKWPDPLSMSVNVSGVQLHQPGFIDDLHGILERTGLDASLLTLEITESFLVNQRRVATILSDLRAIGVGIAIDDFGTGYSSLSYLQQFPVTTIKVDQVFVADLTARREVGLVRSILSIGDAFGLTTVAEGVETAEQLEVLEQLGCDRAQGYYFGAPQSPGEIDGLLEVTRMARTARWRMANNLFA
jgi:diguanylate cyclase (GGDEF)-like protein/PAS domain S-box-containing protein